MHEKKQIPRKHAPKKCTEEQEVIINEIRAQTNGMAWLEAKHEYFENQAMYDKRAEHDAKIAESKITDKDIPDELKDGNIPGSYAEPEKKKKKVMTIEQTKLGVTMVLSKDDCLRLGMDPKTTTTVAIAEIRDKLGLPAKKKKVI